MEDDSVDDHALVYTRGHTRVLTVRAGFDRGARIRGVADSLPFTVHS